MIVIYDLRPVRAILAECRDLRRQARQHPSCTWIARQRIGTNRYTLAAIRANRADLRRERQMRMLEARTEFEIATWGRP